MGGTPSCSICWSTHATPCHSFCHATAVRICHREKEVKAAQAVTKGNCMERRQGPARHPTGTRQEATGKACACPETDRCKDLVPPAPAHEQSPYRVVHNNVRSQRLPAASGGLLLGVHPRRQGRGVLFQPLRGPFFAPLLSVSLGPTTRSNFTTFSSLPVSSRPPPLPAHRVRVVSFPLFGCALHQRGRCCRFCGSGGSVLSSEVVGL